MHAVRLWHASFARLIRERHLSELRPVEGVTEVLDLVDRSNVLVQLHIDDLGPFRFFSTAAGALARIALFLAGIFGLAALGRDWLLGVFHGCLMFGFIVILVAVFLLADVTLLLEWETLRHVRSVHKHRVLLILLAFRSVRAAAVLSHLLHGHRL